MSGTTTGGDLQLNNALRILVVDDNDLVGSLLSELLTEIGYDVSPVESTVEGAIASARTLRPDLMIIDVQLGDGSGIDAAERINRQGFIPHIFVSGATTHLQRMNPGSIFLQKPFLESDLIGAIDRALAVRVAAPRT